MNLIRTDKNQKGQGIVAVIIAAGLVVLVALAVSTLISNYNKNSQRLESSNECQVIAKTVVEYLLKDQASLVVYSYGPAGTGGGAGSANYQTSANNMTTDDGLWMYKIMGAPLSVYGSPALTVIKPLSNSSAQVPANWTFYNYLNIRDSMNRLLAIAGQRQMCCKSGTTCGPPFYQSGSATNPKNLNFAEATGKNGTSNVLVNLGVDVEDSSGSLCGGGNILTKLPDTKGKVVANFTVAVTTDQNTPAAHYCTAHASAQYQPTMGLTPYTIIDLVNNSPTNLVPQSSLCTGKKGNPSVCALGATGSVSLNVETFTDQSGTSCKDFLTNNVLQYSCPLGPQDSFALVNGACLPSFPGSVFFCRIGEQNWFLSAAGQGVWEPCDQAHVWDYDGTTNNGTKNAKVTIKYVRPSGATSLTTDHTTTATITLSGLPERAYMVDVRAVAVDGTKFGPSFCSLSPTCIAGGNQPTPTFVVDTENPTLSGSIMSQGMVVNPAASPPTGGLVSPGSASFAGLYQCQTGQSRFTLSGVVSYPSLPLPPAAAPLGLGGICTPTLIPPAGGTGTASAGAGNVQDGCAILAGASTGMGTFTLKSTYTNDCGYAAAGSASVNWCFDPGTEAFNASVSESSPSAIIPSFNLSVPGKPCGLTYQAPTIAQPDAQGFSTFVNSTSFGISDFKNSGCLSYPGGPQLCAQVYDPCGRVSVANTNYSSLLALGPTVNSCLAVDQYPNVNGNSCAGGFCNSGYQCTTKYNPVGPNSPCYEAKDCIDATNDCPGVDGTCATQCKCVSTIPGFGSQIYTCTDLSHSGACTVDWGPCSASGICSVGGAVCAGAGTACNGTGTCKYSCTGKASLSCKVNADCTDAGATITVTSPRSCTPPANVTCNPCASKPATSGITLWCPVANSCPLAPATPAALTESCTTKKSPPACNITTTTSACVPNTPCSATVTGPQPGTQTVTNTCVPGACSASCGVQPPTPCTYNCPGPCKWTKTGTEADQVSCGTGGAGSCSHNGSCARAFPQDPRCSTIPAGACNCGDMVTCLDDPTAGGNCLSRDFTCQ